MTVSAVSSLSMEPPMLLVCLTCRQPHPGRPSTGSGRFAVNVLAEDQGHLAERFARPSGSGQVHAGRRRSWDAPVCRCWTGALAALECRVAEAVTGGTHRVFLAEVVHAEAGRGLALGVLP